MLSFLTFRDPSSPRPNPQSENAAREPVVRQEPVVPLAREAVPPPPGFDEEVATPRNAAPTQPPNPRPKKYNSLPTGTRVEGDVGTNGHGKLTVENGTSLDATVRLSDAGTDQTARWFFVQAQSSAQVAQIPEGTYRLAFTTGLNWIDSKDTFEWHPSYSEFERRLTYSEERDSEAIQYHSVSVTLHTVPSGNVKTRAISREEFLRGHRHIALQRP